MKTRTTLNRKQKLYVIPSGSGYSCLGFKVCDKRAKALELELAPLGYRVPPPARIGTLKRYHQYRSACDFAEQINRKTGFRSVSELTPELIGLEGKRVMVRHGWNDESQTTSRFWVGKSTGWIPVHLAIQRRNSSGGMPVCLGKIYGVRVIGSR